MIVPMKKVTLLCLEQDKISVLERLRGLGVMQIEFAQTPESDDISALKKQLSSTEKAIQFLDSIPGGKKTPAENILSGAGAAARVLELANHRAELGKELNDLALEREQLLPWGEFRPESLRLLREKGLFTRLCAVRKTDFPEWQKKLPETAAVREISQDKIFIYCLAISNAEFPEEPAGTVDLPRKPLSGVESGIAARRAELSRGEEELLRLKNGQEKILAYAEEVLGKLDFANARDGMAKAGKIAHLAGYVPVTALEKLRAAAKESGMALRMEDPAEDDDNVPTLIVKPKFLNIMDPLFDFIGITPGYRENDVNFFFLIFFPIFFGIIIGDAGYGVLFIAASLICKRVFREKESLRLPLNLFLLLSICTTVWGWLTGSWYGIPRAVLPSILQGWDFMADPVHSKTAFRFAKWAGLINDAMPEQEVLMAMGSFKDKFVQFLCFSLAGIHLSGARLFRFCDDIRATWRASGHLGWAFLLVANALLAIHLIVFPGFFPEWGKYLYIAGIALVAVTVSGIDAVNLPFSLVGSFVDVLSYIRLFAVGLAGAYISQKFDEMGIQLMHSFSGWMQIIGVFALIFVAVFGNVLNIALGFLGVLVHGIRLNTLEFSNHIEMQWAGVRFRPFRNGKNKIQP